MAGFEELNDAGYLAIGLKPEWVTIGSSDYAAPPDAADDGVYLRGSPKAAISIDLREEVHTRTSRVVITTADLSSTTYTVTIDGNAVAYDASSELPASATALVAGIAAAIVAALGPAGSTDQIVNAAPDPDALTTTILITGITSTDYSLNASVSGGSGALTFNADAVSATAYLYLQNGGIVLSGSTASTRWKLPRNGSFDVTWRGLAERIDCAGFGRLALELDAITGHASDGGSITLNVAQVMAGPSVSEATS